MGAKSLISGRVGVGALAQADGAHLRDGADGLGEPRRTASTPAMSVVATAPMPGIMMPSFPVAGLMLAAFDGEVEAVEDLLEARVGVPLDAPSFMPT
jgi:hypothetical protein